MNLSNKVIIDEKLKTFDKEIEYELLLFLFIYEFNK
jgi:hypothetical protein